MANFTPGDVYEVVAPGDAWYFPDAWNGLFVVYDKPIPNSYHAFRFVSPKPHDWDSEGFNIHVDAIERCLRRV